MAMRRIALALIASLGMASARAQAPAETFVAPVTAADGVVTQMQAALCRPADTGGVARLVVIAHGSPPRASARPRMMLTPCTSEAVRWFTGRGYAVAVFLRRGYGATGGTWAESSGKCSRADYAHAGLETARDIAAVVDTATRLPGVRPDGAIVVGQSAGGWGAVAYDSQPHPKVAALISMAGGRGGHEDNEANQNCRPDLLATSAGALGAGATTPMLWIYAANDSYFAPPIAASMRDSFTQAGGKVDLHQIDAFGSDGHRLFFGAGGSVVWGPIVAAYLDRMHTPPL
jgi:pimeloyl-ACP methyl ester carboxylesterase